MLKNLSYKLHKSVQNTATITNPNPKITNQNFKLKICQLKQNISKFEI